MVPKPDLRRVAPWLLGALLGLAAGGSWQLLVHMAAPSVHWRVNPVTDRLRIWLGAGRGPLAGYVARRTGFTTIDTSEAPGQVLVLQLRPGEIFSAPVVVAGPDSARRRILAWAPVPPAVVGVEDTGSALLVRSSLPLVAAPGSPPGALSARRPAVLAIPLDVAKRTVRVEVVARGGGRSHWTFKVPALPEAPLVWFGPRGGGDVYLTIDDGWFPSASLLRLMQRTHLPVMAFLIAQAAKEQPAYWRAFAAAGGLIEDHTATHPDLQALSLGQAEGEWRVPIADYPTWFGVPAPVLGRPPYGAVNARVRAAAWAAGLRELVMWDAEWLPGKGIETWNGAPLGAGDIILLHWVPGVGGEVAGLLKSLAAQGLHPAMLPLPQG